MVVIDNADLAELQSSLFTGVTVGLGSQVLNFENSVSILIQCPFKCEIEGGVKWGHGEEAIDSALLFSFLNHRVEQVSIESDGTLIMRFDVGGVTILPERNGLESYVFTSRLGICPVAII
ncbi:MULTISPECIES: hypothetical protein [unclassified Pseudomonas]|uniref:hypothetical protein n=1 Tax=unclassified Pseudomonas TaxID=196821 RepID=UPI000C2FBBBA|nr:MULTISPECIES: hypothetical protein [unclassified Pseudomonas]MCU1738633.1 hypothetical protein [Pseudomonas sp. 20S_6.2_Bac1]